MTVRAVRQRRRPVSHAFVVPVVREIPPQPAQVGAPEGAPEAVQAPGQSISAPTT
jgi:hypothetical protein